MRKKLIKVLFDAHNKVTDASLFDDATYAQQIEIEADYLIDKGVTFDRDINALTKKVARLEKSNRNWRRKHQRLKADAVSRGVLDQVRWERDVALEQLADYGISLGERADMVKVVRCKDCEHGTCLNGEVICNRIGILIRMEECDYCSYGERKEK